jgi:predicted  nucleic acid-binding Zn-ribbon protein
MTLRAFLTTLRGRLLDRLLGGETLRQRLRDAEANVQRLSAEVDEWRDRANVAESAVASMRRRRTD